MALVNANTAAYLSRVTGLASSTMAMSFWVKVTTWPGASQTFGTYGLIGTVTSPTNGFGVENANGQPSFLFYGNTVNGPEPQLAAGNVASAFTGWQFFFFAVDATGVLTVYYCLEKATPTLLQTTSAANIGNTGTLTAFSPFVNCQGKLASVKAWTGAGATFTLAQIAAESRQQTPVITANLLTYLSGNAGGVVGTADAGANWTVNGAGITLDADKPIFTAPGATLLVQRRAPGFPRGAPLPGIVMLGEGILSQPPIVTVSALSGTAVGDSTMTGTLTVSPASVTAPLPAPRFFGYPALILSPRPTLLGQGTLATGNAPVGDLVLAGLAAGDSILTGLLVGTGALATACVGAGTATGLLTGTGALAASCVGAGTATGLLVGSGALASTCVGAGTATGLLVGSGACVASAAGASTLTGTAAANGVLAGLAAGDSTATLQSTLALSGVAAGSSTATGLLVATGVLVATAIGASTCTGAASAAGVCLGTAAGASTAAGLLVGSGRLACSAAGASSCTGLLVGTGVLAGIAVGSSTATLAAGLVLSGVAAGTSTASGTLTAPGVAVGVAVGASTATGALQAAGQLAAAALGTSAAVGLLLAQGRLLGTATGLSTLTGDLQAPSVGGGLAGIAAGNSTLVGLLIANGVLTGTAVGSSTASLAYEPFAFLLAPPDRRARMTTLTSAGRAARVTPLTANRRQGRVKKL